VLLQGYTFQTEEHCSHLSEASEQSFWAPHKEVEVYVDDLIAKSIQDYRHTINLQGTFQVLSKSFNNTAWSLALESVFLGFNWENS